MTHWPTHWQHQLLGDAIASKNLAYFMKNCQKGWNGETLGGGEDPVQVGGEVCVRGERWNQGHPGCNGWWGDQEDRICLQAYFWRVKSIGQKWRHSSNPSIQRLVVKVPTSHRTHPPASPLSHSWLTKNISRSESNISGYFHQKKEIIVQQKIILKIFVVLW